MVATGLQKYVNIVDKNGQKIGEWAEDKGGSKALCKVCREGEGAIISFKKGKGPLMDHSVTGKHKSNLRKANTHTRQLNLQEAFSSDAEKQELLKQIKMFEIDFARRCDRHNVNAHATECLVKGLKKFLSGQNAHKIVDGMKLSSTKAEYLLKHGIAKTYLDETLAMLEECDAFSIGFDESEVNKNHECEMMVNISMPLTGIQLRHYRTLALEGTDAESIVDSIINQMDDDNIPWRKKLISTMTDNCNTMAGCKTGVKKRLEAIVPELKDTGSCNGHHVSNAAKHGVDALDEDIKHALVNIYFDIGGAKGKGLKKKHDYEGVAKAKHRKLKAIKKFGETRFRSYRICTAPILDNWDTVVEYYTSVKKPSQRQMKLQKFFAQQEFISLLKLNFVIAATKDLNEAINFFEGRTNKIHLVRNKMEEILRCQILKFMKMRAVRTVDSKGNVVRKGGPDLLQVDPDDESLYLERKSMFIGQTCSSLIGDLGLTPNSRQLDFFFEKVLKFHKTVVTKLQIYFEKGLNSTELQYMSGFSPERRTKVETPKQIMHMATQYSKVVNTIMPGTGFDQLRQEIELYQLEDRLNVVSTSLSYDAYWEEVASIRSGSGEEAGDWALFDVLPRLARALGTPFNSGSEMERSFSIQTDVHRDPKRNRMKSETLDTHMQVRCGVESMSTREKCDTCMAKLKVGEKGKNELTEIEVKASKKYCKCHCALAEISDTMVENCTVAWSGADSKEVDEDTDDEQDATSDNEVDDGRLTRLAELRHNLKKRPTFYNPADMQNIYETKEEKKKSRLGDKIKDLKETKAAKVNEDSSAVTCSSSTVSKNTVPCSGITKSLDRFTIPKLSSNQAVASTKSSSTTTKKQKDEASIKISKTTTNEKKEKKIAMNSSSTTQVKGLTMMNAKISKAAAGKEKKIDVKNSSTTAREKVSTKIQTEKEKMKRKTEESCAVLKKKKKKHVVVEEASSSSSSDSSSSDSD